jgi:predicted Rossmann fold flavoprotein
LKIVVIGGGAAGFFAAIHAAQANPQAQVLVLEKTNKLLAKVQISGGGRCNVTHSCFSISEMSKHYPRGERQMKQLLHQFMTTDTIRWFESRGVKLKTEDDGRIFPVTDNSQTVIDCLLKESKKAGVEIYLQHEVLKINFLNDKNFELIVKNQPSILCDRVIVTTGGSPKESGLAWLKALGHDIVSPVPSLFTFNIPQNPIVQLTGTSVAFAKVKIQGTKLEEEGAVLITHWGLSGPAILRLSAWGARELFHLNYHFKLSINWLGKITEDKLRTFFIQNEHHFAKKLITNCNPSTMLDLFLPNRLWEFLIDKIGVSKSKKWSELSKQELNKLINVITNDEYEAQGKTTFKEEFVTCGGVSLNDIDLKTMQSKKVPHLYFAGEVLDLDGLTGGFNFQAAWTTGYIAGKAAGAYSLVIK